MNSSIGQYGSYGRGYGWAVSPFTAIEQARERWAEVLGVRTAPGTPAGPIAVPGVPSVPGAHGVTAPGEPPRSWLRDNWYYVAGGVGAVSVFAGLFVWQRQRRKRQP